MRKLWFLAPITLSVLLNSTECRGQSASAESLTQPILPANTPVILHLTKSLYKKDAKPGQPVEFEVGSDVVVNGQVVIERGAAVNASVRQVDHAGKGPAKVLIDLGYAQTISGETARLAPTRVRSNWSPADFMPIIPVFLVVRLFEKKVLLDKDAGCGLYDFRQPCGVWVAAHVAENVALDPEKLRAAQARLRESVQDADSSIFSHLCLNYAIRYFSYLAGIDESFSESSNAEQADTSISRPLFSLLFTASRLDTEGDLDGAIKEYQQAVELRPDSPELRVLLVLVLAKKGDFAHAIEEQQQALALKPDSQGLHLLLVLVLLEKGDFTHAIEEQQQALALKSDSPGLHLLLAVQFQKRGDFVHAIPEYRTVVQLDPKGQRTREGFVTFLVECDDPDAALAEIKEAMRIWPDNIYFHYVMGKALVKKNDPDGAIVELQWVLKQEENHDWKASCALGSAYELKGDLKAALAQYRTAYRVHMDDEKCRAAYERLHLQVKK